MVERVFRYPDILLEEELIDDEMGRNITHESIHSFYSLFMEVPNLRAVVLKTLDPLDPNLKTIGGSYMFRLDKNYYNVLYTAHGKDQRHISILKRTAGLPSIIADEQLCMSTLIDEVDLYPQGSSYLMEYTDYTKSQSNPHIETNSPLAFSQAVNMFIDFQNDLLNL